MLSLEMTPKEVTSGRMDPGRLAAAVRAIREDGFIILKGVVDLEHVEVLRERMLADLPKILADDEPPFNQNPGNVQQDPPPFPPYLFRDVLFNELVIAVTKGVLGPGLKNSFYSGNTALPGDYTQGVHLDSPHLWPGMKAATPAFGLVVNVPVVDMTPENGSIQLWPGTHLDPSVAVGGPNNRVPEDRVAWRRAQVPPVQPSIARGSVLIRDIRLWHNGMPNRTDMARPMIAMIHWIQWWHDRNPIPFPKGTERLLEHPELRTNAQFVDGPVDYIHRNAQLRKQRRAEAARAAASKQ